MRESSSSLFVESLPQLHHPSFITCRELLPPFSYLFRNEKLIPHSAWAPSTPHHPSSPPP